MDKNKLKEVLKPLLKETLKEILLEEGLTKLISESSVTAKQTIAKQVENKEVPVDNKQKILEAKKKMLDHLAKGGFDPFTGTIPTDENQLLAEFEKPDNQVVPGIVGKGVDISGLIGNNKQAWKSLTNALNGKKE